MGSEKVILFLRGMVIFVDFIFYWGGGVTSKLDKFHVLFLKFFYWYLCSLMKFTLKHTATVIKQDGEGIL